LIEIPAGLLAFGEIHAEPQPMLGDEHRAGGRRPADQAIGEVQSLELREAPLRTPQEDAP
jgi:hypothetical protein